MKLQEKIASFVIFILLLTIAGLVYHYIIEDRPKEQTDGAGIEYETEVLNGVYTNPLIGFGFRYPTRYQISREEFEDLSKEREQRPYVLLLTLEDWTSPQHPKLNLYINADVPIARAERTLTLLQDGIGLYLAEVFEDKTRNSDQVRTVGSIVASDNNVYTFELIFDRGLYDYGPDLEAVISSFGLYPEVENTKIDESVDSEEE